MAVAQGGVTWCEKAAARRRPSLWKLRGASTASERERARGERRRKAASGWEERRERIAPSSEGRAEGALLQEEHERSATQPAAQAAVSWRLSR
eukprot:3018961-Rhodomonas_salina.1